MFECQLQLGPAVKLTTFKYFHVFVLIMAKRKTMEENKIKWKDMRVAEKGKKLNFQWEEKFWTTIIKKNAKRTDEKETKKSKCLKPQIVYLYCCHYACSNISATFLLCNQLVRRAKRRLIRPETRHVSGTLCFTLHSTGGDDVCNFRLSSPY